MAAVNGSRPSVNIPQIALVLPLLLLCFGDLSQSFFAPPNTHTHTLGTQRTDQEVLELSMQRITAATSCDHRGNENQGKEGGG